MQLRLNVEKLNELTMDQLAAIVGADAQKASVLAEVCDAVSALIGVNCGGPTCGPGCTAISNTQTT